MLFYFKLQYKRLLRAFENFGINPYLGLALAVAAFIVISKQFFGRVAYAQYLYPLFAIVPVYTLGMANRNQFLKIIFSNKQYSLVRLLENLFLATPFLIYLLISGYFLEALGTVVICALCSLYNKAGKSGFVIPTPFYKKPFEFITGFRKNYLLLLALYIVAYIALYVHNYNLGMFILLALTLLCMSFCAVTEPDFYVWVYSLSPKAFIKQKIKTLLVYSLLVCLPVAIPFMVAYPLKAYIPLIILLIGALYVIIGFLGRYANYPHQIQLLPTIKMAVGVIIPPALLILIPHFYTQAVNKLNAYLK